MIHRIIGFPGIALLLSVVILGCEKQDPEEMPGTPGRDTYNGILSVWATDAPFPLDLIEKATITITRADIKLLNDTVFQNLSEDTVTFDLLKLRNGIMASLASEEVEPGNYDQLRLYIESASISMADGRTNVLKIPGGEQSGIKIFFDPVINILAQKETNLMLDFDLSKSFILTGNPRSSDDIRGFSFKPVIRAAVLENAGIITGRVTDFSGKALPNSEVRIAEDTLISTTYTDRLGTYTILGIPEGQYTVAAILEGFIGQESGGIPVSTDEKTVFDFQLSAAQ